MQIYVTSLSAKSALAHIGEQRPLCGAYLVGEVRHDDAPLPDRRVCVRCVGVAVTQQTITGQEAAALLVHNPPPGPAPEVEMPVLVALLREGLTDAAVSRRTGMSVRAITRRIRRDMDELRVTSRFAYGYACATRDYAREARA